MTIGQSILLEAHNLIKGQKREEYGDAEKGMTMIAEQWSLYLQQKYQLKAFLLPEDVCWMMADLKKVRQLLSHKRDNIVDAAGYIGLIQMVSDEDM